MVDDELLTIEQYSYVMHLVSNIKGTLRCECTLVDLIRTVLVGGTITVCSQVRCICIIEELEPTRRSLFYGSPGYLDWRGNLDSNILIHTQLLAPSPPLTSSYKDGKQSNAVVPSNFPLPESKLSVNQLELEL